MSLRVWLPLTKDLRNQGLDGATVTNNGATYSATGGKLGGCYNFTNSYCAINVSLGVTASIACWTKTSTNGKMSWVLEDDTYGYLNLYEQDVYTLNAGDSNNNPFKTNSNTNISCLHDGQWHHFVVTFGNNIAKLYIDGEYQGTARTFRNPTTTNKRIKIGGYYKNAHSYDWNGAINDFRVYDHCLSPTEVKQLSQGLVLHYPLNRNGWGQENLILNSANISVNKLNNTLDSRTEYWAANVGQSYSNFVGGEEVVLSFDCEMIIRTKPVYFIVYNTNNKGPIQFPTMTVSSQINDLNPSIGDTVKLRVKIPATMVKRDSPSTTNNFIEFYTSYGSNNFYKIDNLKLELGSIATPWCPNSSDVLALTMGLNGTTEYDCSGFCNNGTRTGTFEWTSNTPKYAVSQIFNGTNNAIQTPSLPTMITDKNYTIAVWIYKTVIGSKGYQTIYGGPSGFEIEARNGSANETKFVPWNWGKPMASYELNEWNHCVFVHSDSDCKIYLNGEYIATGTAKASNPTGNYFIGAWNTATQQNFDGLMSDFRIYATALSASDVKSLYQNCATIDPDGTIRGQIRS